MDGRLPDCGSQLPGFVIYFLFQIFCSLWLRTTRPTIGKIFSIAPCSPAMEAADISWSQGDKNISWDHGDIKIYFETKKMTWPTCVSFHDMDQISYALLDYHLNQLGSWESPKCTPPKKPAWQGIAKPEFPGLELTVEVHPCFHSVQNGLEFLNLLSGDLWTAPSKKWRHWVWCWQWCCRPIRRGLFDITLILS